MTGGAVEAPAASRAQPAVGAGGLICSGGAGSWPCGMTLWKPPKCCSPARRQVARRQVGRQKVIQVDKRRRRRRNHYRYLTHAITGANYAEIRVVGAAKDQSEMLAMVDAAGRRSVMRIVMGDNESLSQHLRRSKDGAQQRRSPTNACHKGPSFPTGLVTTRRRFGLSSVRSRVASEKLKEGERTFESWRLGYAAECASRIRRRFRFTPLPPCGGGSQKPYYFERHARSHILWFLFRLGSYGRPSYNRRARGGRLPSAHCSEQGG